jgi:hypothetical protein
MTRWWLPQRTVSSAEVMLLALTRAFPCAGRCCSMHGCLRSGAQDCGLGPALRVTLVEIKREADMDNRIHAA